MKTEALIDALARGPVAAAGPAPARAPRAGRRRRKRDRPGGAVLALLGRRPDLGPASGDLAVLV